MNAKEKFIRELLKGNKTKFFGVKFIKTDGTERNFSCRLGVSSHVTGQGLKYDPKSRSNLIVWVPNAEGNDPHNKYRTVKIPNIISLKVRKQEFTWSSL
jgi:hypothetical protein